MSLARFIYTSRQTTSLNLKQVKDILSVASAKNRQAGMTGILCYARPYFVQCLEGDYDDVCRTLQSIYRDQRHTDIQLVCFDRIAEREFHHWSMRFIDPEAFPQHELRAMCRRHGGDLPLHPDDMSDEQLFEFLRELSNGGVSAAPVVSIPTA